MTTEKFKLLAKNFRDLLMGFAPVFVNPKSKLTDDEKLQCVIADLSARTFNYDPDLVCELAAKLLEEVNQHDLALAVRNGINEPITL